MTTENSITHFTLNLLKALITRQFRDATILKNGQPLIKGGHLIIQVVIAGMRVLFVGSEDSVCKTRLLFGNCKKIFNLR